MPKSMRKTCMFQQVAYPSSILLPATQSPTFPDINRLCIRHSASPRTSWKSHALQVTQGEHSLMLKATSLPTSEVPGFLEYHKEVKPLQLSPCFSLPLSQGGSHSKVKWQSTAQGECARNSLCATPPWAWTYPSGSPSISSTGKVHFRLLRCKDSGYWDSKSAFIAKKVHWQEEQNPK